MTIKLSIEILNRINLIDDNPFFKGISQKYYNLNAGQEPYKLLAYLSNLKQHNDRIL